MASAEGVFHFWEGKTMNEKEQEQERQINAVEAFMQEKLYWRVVRMAKVIRERPWSKQMTNRDAEAISEIARFLDVLANGLYNARNGVKIRFGERIAELEAEAKELKLELSNISHDLRFMA
jgi:hypothetical protein